VIKEDSKNGSLLYMGTDHGLYVSRDGGKHYEVMQGSLPNVANYDMAIQEKENHLVVATHGRSVYVLYLSHMHKIAENSKAVHALETPDVRLNPRWANAGYSGGNKPSQSFL
jgi:photosystem II stability/assembly factor-like uncharacterized protein